MKRAPCLPAHLFCALGAVGIIHPTAVLAQCETQKLMDDNQAAICEKFGSAVSADGDFLAVGAPAYQPDWPAPPGAVFIFQRENGSWVQKQKIRSMDGPTNHFGFDVSLSGDRFLVGSESFDAPGAAHIYRREGTAWVLEQSFTGTPPASHDGFGASVSLSGDLAVIVSADTVYVYHRSGTNWTIEAQIPTSGNGSGFDVAIDGSFLVESSMWVSSSIYRRVGTSWVQEAAINEWGAVGVSGNVVAVGHPDCGSSCDGRTLIFRRQTSGTWLQEAVLDTKWAWWPYGFGFLDVLGNEVAVGQNGNGPTTGGALYLYRYEGGAWSEKQILIASEQPAGGYDKFGGAVSLSSDYIVSGFGGDSCGASPNDGAAFVYDRIGLTDCDGNHFDDNCEVLRGFGDDCNENTTLDFCDIADGTSSDFFPNGVPDECDPDCNNNDVPDNADIGLGTSEDCENNGVPDECEPLGVDCNGNNVRDDCDPDCNDNGTPDDCDLADETSLDCNATLLPDECELSGNDCNQNGIPDECDLSSAASDDCNDDSIPDECQTDCNFNGLHDLCDVDSGESNDCNANLIPDECEADCNLNDIEDSCDILAATSNDVDNNGVPDECCPPPCGPPALLANPTGLCSGSGAACDVPSNNCPAGQTCVPWKMNRFISFSIPTGGPSQQTAIRVKLTYLHRPSDPAPPNTPNFSAHEGHYRYVNLVRDAVNNAFLMCSDSAVPGGSFPCARLGCTPEYRNWASSFGGSNVYVYGDAVVPDSTYQVARLGASCLGNEPYCTNVSPQLAISTSRWGNIDNSSAGSAVPNAIDLGLVVTKVKNSPGALIEPRCMLREGTPDPLFASVSVLDAARAVEALKGLPYPFQIGSCP